MNTRKIVPTIGLALCLALGSLAAATGIQLFAPQELGVVEQAHAATKTGVYKINNHTRKHDFYSDSFGTSLRSSYEVRIKSVKKNKVTFYIESNSIRVDCYVRSNTITATLKKGKASFYYKTSPKSGWKSKGKGTLILGKGYVKIRVSETWHENNCRLGLGTGGWMKIKKGVHRKWYS